jgi:predicted dehydrogenase
MERVSIIGCGFVADLYMRSLATFSHVLVDRVYDRDANRLMQFCTHWDLNPVHSLTEFFDGLPKGSLILNLTNPKSHFEVNKACLEAGHHVYSEKPLAVDMSEAQALFDLAEAKNLMVASAPCSVLGEAAQTLGKALREDVAGTPRLIYAELDDGFIPQAPFQDWKSETGAPWPAEDEFQVGCTLEHAGYYLAWLISYFGSVERVVSASAEVIPDKDPSGAGTPDYASATLFFENGPVTRLTCSIVAPHDHQIRIMGDKGVLGLKRAWDNRAPVKFYRRMRLRRRLLELPFGRRIRLNGATHPFAGKWGAANMNFALGPVEMLESISENRPCRLSNEFALHLNEVTLAMQNAGAESGSQVMTTCCSPMEPMPWAI